MSLMHIEFGSHDPIILDFQIRNTNLARRWTSKVRVAQRLGYEIDEPRRFYGVDDVEQSRRYALEYINHQIDIIESNGVTVSRRPQNCEDQDTLNYLHHIFERFHGLLDQQNSPEWLTGTPDLRRALALLNTAVHRCESVAQGADARMVVTYYGLPKKHVLELDDYDLIEKDYCFGTVMLCYAEIGKTLYDLSKDNDHYISDDAFQPFHHYTADFVVQFHDSTPVNTQELERNMWKYYDQHQSWFEQKGFHRAHPLLRYGHFPVADLVSKLPRNEILNLLQPRQYARRVWFSI